MPCEALSASAAARCPDNRAQPVIPIPEPWARTRTQTVESLIPIPGPWARTRTQTACGVWWHASTSTNPVPALQIPNLDPGRAPGRRLRRLVARQHVHKPRARRAAEHRRRVRLGQVRVQRVRVELRQHVPAPRLKGLRHTHRREVGAAQPGLRAALALKSPCTACKPTQLQEESSGGALVVLHRQRSCSKLHTADG